MSTAKRPFQSRRRVHSVVAILAALCGIAMLRRKVHALTNLQSDADGIRARFSGTAANRTLRALRQRGRTMFAPEKTVA